MTMPRLLATRRPGVMVLGLLLSGLVLPLSAPAARPSRPPALTVLSPPGAETTVAAAAITVEVAGTGLRAVTVTNTTLGVTVPATESRLGPGRQRRHGQRGRRPRPRDGSGRPRRRPRPTGRRFLAFNVPLGQGANTLAVEATAAGGTSRHTTLTVTTTQPRAAVSVAPEPTVVEGTPGQVTLHVRTELTDAPVELLLDHDGDGSIDEVLDFTAALTVTYDTFGRFLPRVTVRTDANLLFTNDPTRARPVAVVPPSAPDPAQAFDIGSDPVDLAFDWHQRRLYVLSGSDATVRLFEATGTLVRTIPLPGATRPQGLSVDAAGNLYIADTGNHRILKLLASADFAPDAALGPEGAFGSQGSGAGQFESPDDVAVGTVETATAIFVADTGNNRIQRFDRAGVFALAFDGSAAAVEPLREPRGLHTLGMVGGLVVLDSGNGRLCRFDHDGTFASCAGTLGSAPGYLQDPAKVTLASGGVYVVADTGNSRVQLFRPNGRLQRVVALSTPPRAALLDTTEHGQRLLVAPATGTTLTVVPLTVDAPDATPVRVVQAFLAALSARDLVTAREFVAVHRRAAFETRMQDSKLLDQVAERAQVVNNLTLRQLHRTNSWVTGQLALGGSTQRVEFLLERDIVTGLWKIKHF
jgi:hypothetical protein